MDDRILEPSWIKTFAIIAILPENILVKTPLLTIKAKLQWGREPGSER